LDSSGKIKCDGRRSERSPDAHIRGTLQKAVGIGKLPLMVSDQPYTILFAKQILHESTREQEREMAKKSKSAKKSTKKSAKKAKKAKRKRGYGGFTELH
jgi:hypothetical protein